MKKIIIGIGEIVWDVFPKEKHLGGAPVNFAYMCRSLGACSYAVSAIGNDTLGDETLEAVRGTGIDLSCLQRNAMPTSRVLVTTDPQGIPSYDILEGVAWDALECTDRERTLASYADAVCWGSLAQRSLESRSAILEIVDSVKEGCLKVFDINIRQNYFSPEIISTSLERADILKVNEDELPLLKEMYALPEGTAATVAELIARFGLSHVIYTAGAAFSEVYDASGLLSHIDTPKVEVADTVGAGDAFTAAFVCGMLEGRSIAKCHERAVAVSAYVCTCKGAINPIPEELK